MNLYCNCGPCGKKMILQNKAVTRQDLAQQIGHSFNITCGHCKITSQGTVSIVFAESSYKHAPIPSAVIVGIVGVFFGPLATVVGLAVGGAAGVGIKNSDKQEVDRFNNS